MQFKCHEKLIIRSLYTQLNKLSMHILKVQEKNGVFHLKMSLLSEESDQEIETQYDSLSVS